VRVLLEHKAIDKPKLQLLAPPVLLLCTELLGCDKVIKEAISCLEALEANKKKVQGVVKKQVAFIIRLFAQMIGDFGPLKMCPKLGYVGICIKYISDTDKAIREACYSALLELSGWMDITALLKSLEEPQRKELEKRRAEQGESKKEVKRRYRGEAVVEAGGATASAAVATVDLTTALETLDNFDDLEAVDISKKLPKGWCITEVLTMETWKPKQAHLKILSELLESTLRKKKLASCDLHHDMTDTIKRLVKTETNIPIVQEVAKCMGLLAKGLRKDYERPARALLPVVVGRMTDKSVWKQQVLIENLELLLWAVPFECFLEELKPFVASKSLFAKKEAMMILRRALDLPQVRLDCPDVSQRFFNTLAKTVLPNVDDTDNNMRQEAHKFLADLVKRNCSSPDVGSILDKVPPHRRSAFEEEWKKVAKDLPCPWGFAAAAEQEEKPKASATGRRPSPRGKVRDSDASSAAQSRPASPRREGPSRGDVPSPPAR